MFPKSANVWDRLAEAYAKAGDSEAARIYYQKALKLDPKNANARQKLEQLKKAAK
jgi:Tfp pilus assembly protein PilF